MDNVKFGVLISYLTSLRANDCYDTYTVEHIAKLVEACKEPASHISAEEINNLMKVFSSGTNKIEAIKSYRALTGFGLKESKDAVEKYWTSKPAANGTY